MHSRAAPGNFVVSRFTLAPFARAQLTYEQHASAHADSSGTGRPGVYESGLAWHCVR